MLAKVKEDWPTQQMKYFCMKCNKLYLHVTISTRNISPQYVHISQKLSIAACKGVTGDTS